MKERVRKRGMDQMKVKDRILENISLSVKKLQSYFAACEDETPAIRNHDRVLQRLCEHLDHALLYGLQDISSGYWVLVVHFTRREAIRQIEELHHIATNMGRSRAWLYLALSESSLESYLRLFQENQGLLHKYYFKNALVCSHDHLTLFLTLVSGLEFIRFNLDLDAPYLDLAPYMPDYYKPQNLLDFEDRLPSSDSLSLNSLNSITSTNLEWDDSAIAPSSEDYDFGDVLPVLQSMPSADWEEGDLTDPVSCPRSTVCEPPSLRSNTRSPTSRYNPFNEDSDTATSADVTPVHSASRDRSDTAGEDTESTGTELEVIRLARRRKTGKKKQRTKSGLETANECDVSLANEETQDKTESSEQVLTEWDNVDDSRAPSLEEEEGGEGLRLPEMADTSMDSVGQPLREVIDQLDVALDTNRWRSLDSSNLQQSFRNNNEGEPPDPPLPTLEQALHQAISPNDFYRFTPESPGTVATSGGYNDPARDGLSADVSSSNEGEGARTTQTGEGSEPLDNRVTRVRVGEIERNNCLESMCEQLDSADQDQDVESFETEEETTGSPAEITHPAEFGVDNNHLLLLMIHVFRESEEQLFKMVKMSTGHMEGNLQPLYLLFTDCYIYLLRKGAAEKPYTIEEAVSYNELDYISVGLDQQTVTLVCTNRRRQFLLDTADGSLTEWLLGALQSAMVKGCREPPYPSVLTDATMERLALMKFVAQESHCEVAEVSIQLYALVHWEDPHDVTLGPQRDLYTNVESNISKEGVLYYRAGTSYLGKEIWKSCYLVLSSNGILYQYPDRTDVIPLLSINMGGEQCGGCRRSNTTERPHSFQVILTDRPALELSADNEEDMAGWMQHLCQSVSKGIIPQGVTPTPCIPCCLVQTDKKLFTCHEDCQTSFFRFLGGADLTDVKAICTEPNKEYCIIEFAEDRKQQFLPPWVLYFSCTAELDRFLFTLETAWQQIFQVALPRRIVMDTMLQKKCQDALCLIRSAWQRSDSLWRGRAERDPWC
ncbi:pleckstrin homology domain-containing family M member 2 isoform X1 [Polypterus senegalus]|uniref:pleckstrin homology domain-containing family M member 2 isoform X1 n=1 Tax=Polypterus senegalus TaxID=55291 RepID=UPI001964D3B3|nr:pleckstrin homology domain-containing family M member 2 isoform X1 [Polypterus senegalus]